MAEGEQDLLTGDDADSGDDSTTDQQQAVTLESLQAEIASLRAQNDQAVRGFTAAVGRYQALETKVAAGRGDAGVLEQLTSQQEAMTEALAAVLDDETVSDKVKARAQAAFDKAEAARSTARERALQARVDALEAARAGGATGGAQSAGISSFEAGILGVIEAAGLDADDPAFDWKGEASRILSTQGEAAARTYFQKQIRGLLAADSRRDNRKAAAGTANSGSAAGKNTSPLDASRPIEDRLKHLQSLGVI